MRAGANGTWHRHVRRRRGLAMLAGTALALVGAEAAFTIYRLARHGELTRRTVIEQRERVRREDPVPGETSRWESELVLHPLFGYVLNPKSAGINNFGFRCPHDFELSDDGYRLAGIDRDNAVVIGIFGGSFADYTGMQARHLERCLEGAFPGRRPVVADMAMGGHALPQAGYIFLYFKEAFDVVVFLDGLNEVWNAPANNAAGCPPEYAKAGHYLHKLSRQELSPETFACSARILDAKRKLAAVTDLSLAPLLRESLLLHYAVWRPLSRMWQKRIAEQSLALEALYASDEPFFDVPDARIIAHAVARWRRHHAWMHEVASQDGILDIHLLQPSPWVEGSKRLDDEERDAIQRLQVGDRVRAGYPGLRREVAACAAAGWVAEDLTMMLRDRTETLWMDGAHLNAAGSRLVAERIAALIRAHWRAPAQAADASHRK